MTITAADLREMLEGVPDDYPVVFMRDDSDPVSITTVSAAHAAGLERFELYE